MGWSWEDGDISGAWWRIGLGVLHLHKQQQHNHIWTLVYIHPGDDFFPLPLLPSSSSTSHLVIGETSFPSFPLVCPCFCLAGDIRRLAGKERRGWESSWPLRFVTKAKANVIRSGGRERATSCLRTSAVKSAAEIWNSYRWMTDDCLLFFYSLFWRHLSYFFFFLGVLFLQLDYSCVGFVIGWHLLVVYGIFL